ncbi:MAG: methyltransferase [Acidobacteriaceae bacterium]
MTSGGYFLSRCLQVAAELGVADLIANVPVSATELAATTGSSADALGRVLSLLCAHGIFERCDGGFAHTEVSRFLRSDHPASMRSFARMFGNPVMWQSVIRLDETIATGEPMGEKVTPGGLWQYLAEHKDRGEVFNQTMVAKARVMVPLIPRAYDFTRFPRIADIGGGRGHLLEAILAASPDSRGVLFDQPQVVGEVANLASDRLALEGGNFFEDALPQADAYVLMEVIHDWDDPSAERILRSVRRAAPAGAKLVIVEAKMMDPPMAGWTATLDIVMLNLLGGRQRGFGEYRTLLERSGFGEIREIPVGMGHFIIEASPA